MTNLPAAGPPAAGQDRAARIALTALSVLLAAALLPFIGARALIGSLPSMKQAADRQPKEESNYLIS